MWGKEVKEIGKTELQPEEIPNFITSEFFIEMHKCRKCMKYKKIIIKLFFLKQYVKNILSYNLCGFQKIVFTFSLIRVWHFRALTMKKEIETILEIQLKSVSCRWLKKNLSYRFLLDILHIIKFVLHLVREWFSKKF